MAFLFLVWILLAKHISMAATLSFPDFLALMKKFLENTSIEVRPSALVNEILYDDLAKVEVVDFFEREANVTLPSLESVEDEMTLTMLYERAFNVRVADAAGPKNLYFRRLLQGVDLSLNPKDAMQQLRFQVRNAAKKILVVVQICSFSSSFFSSQVRLAARNG